MNRKWITVLLTAGILLVVSGILVGCVSQTAAPGAEATAPTETEMAKPAEMATPTAMAEPALTGNAVRGGLLYDKWWAELGIGAPSGEHPLMKTQSTSKASGADTWRCKECHGWDYKGVDGAYGAGSHMTGFAGILKAAEEKTAAELLAALKGATNPDHDFSGLMGEQDLIDLALFMDETLVDAAAWINDDKSAKGDAVAGEQKYMAVCTNCHGPQGNAINFGDLAEPEFTAHVAGDNPWEFIHKVRYGQPGWPMPSSILNQWSEQDVADVMAYTQKLSTDASVGGGGQLYDKWWAVLGVDAPSGDHPLMKTQSTSKASGADTWRCKECHGWDYMGADGAYGSGSHMTGFKGVLGAAAMSSDELTAWLSGQKNAEHDFSQVMDETAIAALVDFIQKGVTDWSSLVNADGSAVGDPVKGKEIFTNTCAHCHGEDGRKLNFGSSDEPEFVGTIAVDNPREFFHKVSFGQPAEPMPSGIALNLSMAQLGDLLAHAQTLPVR